MKYLIFLILLLLGTRSFSQTFDKSDLFGQAQNHFYNREFYKSLLICKKLVQTDSNTEDALYLLAQTYAELDSFEKEIETLELATKRFPENEEIWFRYGKIQIKERNFTEAIISFEKILSIIETKNIQSYLLLQSIFELGNAYLGLKEYSKAIDYYSKVLSINPKNNAALANRGVAYYNSKMKAEACNDWRDSAENGLEESYQMYNKYCK